MVLYVLWQLVKRILPLNTLKKDGIRFRIVVCIQRERYCLLCLKSCWLQRCMGVSIPVHWGSISWYVTNKKKTFTLFIE